VTFDDFSKNPFISRLKNEILQQIEMFGEKDMNETEVDTDERMLVFGERERERERE
jgi:hypothetical protein